MTSQEISAERERVQRKLDASIDHDGKPKPGAKDRVDAINARLAELDGMKADS